LCAGGDKLPFSPESIRYIADASNGIPRVINSLCDNALALALSEGLTTIDARHVRGAAADLQLNVLPPLAMSCETNGVGPRELRTDVGSTHADYGFESIPTI
jgi:hypothetical protein